jgi:hypothetical protein
MPLKSKLQKVVRYIFNPDLYRFGIRSMFRLSNLNDSPIIICGAPRSGTTLLISILGSHKEIVSIPYETWLFINTRKERWFKKESWNRKFLLMQLNAFLISLNITKEHKRWCEKTPDNVLHLDFIFSLFKRKVKVIHIVRDGRDVVMSVHKKLGKFMTSKKWKKYVEAGLLYKDDPDVLTIHYEDIILNFDKTMNDISDFLEIKNTFQKSFFLETNVTDNASVISGYGNKGLYIAKPISTQSLFKWKENPAVIQEFNEYQPAMELLIELGYET